MGWQDAGVLIHGSFNTEFFHRIVVQCKTAQCCVLFVPHRKEVKEAKTPLPKDIVEARLGIPGRSMWCSTRREIRETDIVSAGAQAIRHLLKIPGLEYVILHGGSESRLVEKLCSVSVGRVFSFSSFDFERMPTLPSMLVDNLWAELPPTAEELNSLFEPAKNVPMMNHCARIDLADGNFTYAHLTEPIGELSLGTLVFYHGNGETVSQYSTVSGGFRTKLAELGWRVVCVEYRGYHNVHTSGLQNMDNVADDVDRVLKWASKSFQQGPMVVYGRSIGSLAAISAAKATTGPPTAIIIESGFSQTGLQARLSARGLNLVTPLSLTATLQCYEGKVLLFGSQDDHIVPAELNYRELASVVNDKAICVLFERGRHNVAVWNEEIYWSPLKDFLSSLIGTKYV